MAGPLEGIRVLDLTTPLAEPTGRVLADLGAEVIKIEPPGGCASRFTPPFESGKQGDPMGSLFWRAWGLGKRSVVLDLTSESDRTALLELARGADVFIESGTPGELESQGLGAEALCAANPALLYVSVTPFGQTGPDARNPATDLTLAAAGGLLQMQGDPDRVPLPVGYPEASCHGAVQAAADTVLALYARNRTGRGQHLDTSMQAAIVWTLLHITGYTSFDQDPPGFGDDRPERLPGQSPLPGINIPAIAPCKDGHVVMTLILGEVGAQSCASLLQYAIEHGALDEDLHSIDWLSWVPDVAMGKLPAADAQRAIDQFKIFLTTKTKRELHDAGLERRWLLAPVLTVDELLEDPQLASRDYWTEVDGLLYCGPFAKLSKTPIRYAAPPPKLGEHQDLVRSGARVPARPLVSTDGERSELLAGLKVADFSWVGAGPLVGKDLANLGATVLRVETEKRVDALRFIPPWKGDLPNVSTSHPAANMNQSKLGVAVDLATEQGREVALRMVDWADVVIESFTPGTAEKLGLDYETLRARRPDIVMLSSCMRGQTGPERKYTGFGLQGASLAGFVAITGWPDRAPQGPWGAYTDFIAPRFSLAALGAALYHRDRTGEGQYIDLSQVEAAMHYLEPVFFDAQVNGRRTQGGGIGMDSERACPHGVYATLGTDRYLTIAVETAEQWRALQARVPELAALADGLDTLTARQARGAEIDALLGAWCAERDAAEAGERLRDAGVPAHAVVRARDLRGDRQLAARGFFIELDHAAIGRTHFDGAVTLFSDTPARPKHGGPTIGQHTFDVLTGMLEYSEEEISEIAASGALT